MLKIIFLISILLFIPAIASAVTIHGVNVPNECLASISVKENAQIKNLSGFPLWRSFEGKTCKDVELIRGELFIKGLASKSDNDIKDSIDKIPSLVKALEEAKEKSWEATQDIVGGVIWSQVSVITSILGCVGSGGTLCAIGAVSATQTIHSTIQAISEGADINNNMRQIRNTLQKTADKLEAGQSELESLSINEVKKRAKIVTEELVDMCRLVQSNCK